MIMYIKRDKSHNFGYGSYYHLGDKSVTSLMYLDSE